MTRDDAFLLAADAVLDLVDLPEVAVRWSQPSALPRLTVGGLAVHLGNQVVRAAELLPREPGDLPVLADADEHYARSAWPTAAPEDTPSSPGSAMGFLNMPCMHAPETASAAPTI